MLKITEQSTERMVLEDKRRSAGIVAGTFTLFSAGSLLFLAYNAVDTLILGPPKDLMAWRYFGVTIFLLIMAGFVAIGLLVTVHFLRGITWVIDKNAEVITLTQPHFFRQMNSSYSIYGVSSVDIERNDELRSHGIMLVLRSGERVPVTAYAIIDQEPMERLIAQVRAYLRTVGGVT